MNQDLIIRTYSRLVALKNNLPEDSDTKEKYVKDYHDIIVLLENETGLSLDEFQVPEIELEYRITSSWPSLPNIQEGGRTYSKDRYCERPMLLSKIDALLSYFQIRFLSEEKRSIGFQLPEK